MKKFRLFALIFCLMLSGIVFSACGDKYKNLQMSFYMQDQVCESVTLYLGDEDAPSSANLSVSFDGIKEEDIGAVQIYASKPGLVTITELSLDNDVYYFTISANNPIKNAQLIVKHMASDKTASINLNIEKKSTNLVFNKTEYVFAVPDSGSKTSYINASSLFSIMPLDSTDRILFKCANSNSLPTGVSFADSIIIDGESYFTGFNIDHRVNANAFVDIYPVTVFNNKAYVYNRTIVARFVNVLKAGDLVLNASRDVYQQSLNSSTENKPLTLLWNDYVSKNCVDVSLATRAGLSELNAFVSGLNSVYSADIEVEFNKEFVSVEPNGLYGYSIFANRAFDSASEVRFKLLPKNYVAGELDEVAVSVFVEGKTRAKNINVYQDDVIKGDSELNSLELYNSYDNKLGSKFKFENTPYDVMSDFNSMRIVVEAGLLDFVDRNNAGFNPIYTEDGRLVTTLSPDGKTNNNLLQIRLNNKEMKFYLFGNTYVSETFYQRDTLHIMYTENSMGAVGSLKMKVETFYDGELEYLQDSEVTSQTITFNNKEGVTAFDIVLGSWNESDSSYDNSWDDGTHTEIYLNREDLTRYGFNFARVLGVNEKPIAEASFNIEVKPVEIISGEGTNPLKLVNTNRLTANGEPFVRSVYNYSSGAGNSNFPIQFYYFNNDDENSENNYLADVGSYLLTITNPNGLKKEVLCYVYEDLKKEDLEYNLLDGNFLQGNTVGVDADYVVAVGQTLKLDVVLDKIFTERFLADASLVSKYEYAVNYSNEALDERRCLIVNAFDNYALLNFRQGSFVEKEEYAYVDVKVYTKNFNRIFASSGDNSVGFSLSFYIYPKLNNNLFNLVAENERYPENELSYYYKDDSIINISLNMTALDANLDEYFNYVQPVLQSFDFSGATDDETKGVENKVAYQIISAYGNWTSEKTDEHWYLVCTDKEKVVAKLEVLNLDAKNLKLKVISQTDKIATYTFKVFVYQFGARYDNVVSVTVKRPILTEQLFVDNLQFNNDLGYYVNIDAGSPWEVKTSDYSNEGYVTYTGADVYIAYQERGVGEFTLTKNYANGRVRVVGNHIVGNQIVVNADSDFDFSNLKIIAFAINQLKLDPLNLPDDLVISDIEGFKDITISGNPNCFMAFDLIVSTGSRTNPYLITSANDLSKLEGAGSDVYYQVMNDINLLGYRKVIKNCTANISTLNDNQYNFTRLVLDNGFANLFEGFEGKLANIGFDVAFNYRGNFASNNLGVFDAVGASAKLINVSVNFSAGDNGNVLLTKNVNFGALAGINEGEIIYTKDIVGTSGSLEIIGGEGNSVYFGGLVGLNNASGKIIGFDRTVEMIEAFANEEIEYVGQDVVLNAGSETGVLANVYITATSLRGASSVGGVVGRNLSEGKLKNLTATGKIVGNSTIGGIIGSNYSEVEYTLKDVGYSLGGQYLDLTLENSLGGKSIPNHEVTDYTLIDSVSSVVIEGNSYLGGIVGEDTFGKYKNCKYQISALTQTGISGVDCVGGIAGSSVSGLFEYCSVSSYKWDFANLKNGQFDNADADLEATNRIGGIVGSVTSGSTGLGQGVNNLNNVTFVNASSVNAYLRSYNKEEDVYNKVAGIFTVAGGRLNIMFNCYFMGKLEGNFSADCALTDDNSSSYYTNLYAVMVNGSAVEEAVYPIDGFTIKASGADLPPVNAPWNYNSTLNGGYIYLEYKNRPIFEIAPTNILATVRDEFTYSSPESRKGTQITTATKLGEKSLLLNYYQFKLDESETNQANTLQNLNNWFNTYNIKDLIAIKVDPKVLSSVNIKAESTNPQVVEIVGGELIVRSVGTAKIRFTSALNSKISDEIEIEVVLPLGDSFVFRKGTEQVFDGDEITIQKDKAVSLSINAMGAVQYTGPVGSMNKVSYNFTASADYVLEISATLKKGELGDVNKYINIQNIPFEENKLTVSAGSLDILAVGADGEVVLEILPVLKVDGVRFEGQVMHITIKTAIGPTDVSLDFDNAVVYPDFTYLVSAKIASEVGLSESIKEVADWLDVKNTFGYWQILRLENDEWVVLENAKDVVDIRLVKDEGFDDNVQTLTFGFRFATTETNRPYEYMARFVVVGVDENVESQTRFTLLPQKIDDIDVKNFIFREQDGETLLESDSIEPYRQNLIIIEMLPTTGYFDYLEIKDITGRELIRFSQVKNIDREPIGHYPVLTEDGRGIVLEKLEQTENGLPYQIYVLANIDSSFANITHTLQVRAFINGGIPVSDSKNIEVKVRLLPGVLLSYIKPDGSTAWQEDTTSTRQDKLAAGTNALFRAEPINSDGEISAEFRILDENNVDTRLSEWFELVDLGNFNYTLRLKNVAGSEETVRNVSELLGKKVEVTFTTFATLANGAVEKGVAKATFEFVSFVVHSVSTRPSRTVGGRNEIYGNINYMTELEIFFANNDISFYDNGDDGLEYHITDEEISEIEAKIKNNTANLNDKTKYAVYNILKALNGYVLQEDGSYVENSANHKQVNSYLHWTEGNTTLNEGEDGKGTLFDAGVEFNSATRSLTVRENYTAQAFAVQFSLDLDRQNGYVYKLIEELKLNPDYQQDRSQNILEYNKQYGINFNKASVEFEPTLVKDEAGFLAMAGSESEYILGKDLVLTNYSPIPLDVRMFDGNGHTITIKSFGNLTSADMQLGLFTEISATSLVMNLQVKYELVNERGVSSSVEPHSDGRSFVVNNRYVLGSSDATYNSVNMGGLAVVNNGVITNCKVIGTFAVERPNAQAGSGLDFNIGGLVKTNAGYITNSVSALRVATIANVGGLVYENSRTGKIAASSFVARDENNVKNGLLYIYYGENTDYADIRVGGFVVNNSGEILMSYVDVGTSKTYTGFAVGNMTTKDPSAGFVYNNSGSISNSYVNLEKFGLNSSSFDGFVYSGSGSIDYCYSYVNGGVNITNNSLFAPSSVTNINNSYVVIADNGSTAATNGIEGLDIVYKKDMIYASAYPSFTFGSSVAGTPLAVWYVNNNLPVLVSCLETTAFASYSEPDNDASGEITTYYGLKNIEERKTYENGTETYTTTVDYSQYGTASQPYIIYNLRSWQHNFVLGNETKYFRLVADINFASSTPVSATLNFQGNIQGNGMNISAYNLYTFEELNSIGLFASLQGVYGVDNAVRNINIIGADIRAVQTEAVGSLAGIVDNFNLYNISINSNSTIIGNSAVGGLAGFITGNRYDVERIISNASVNSTYTPSALAYNIYVREDEPNLANISYAGSVFGIADAEERTLTSYLKDIVVEGNISLVGDTVGGAVGLVGDSVCLQNAKVNYNGNKLGGYQYSGGVVGENRGIVNRADVRDISENEETMLFEDSYSTSAGLVGLNLGGLVMNSSAKLDIVRTEALGAKGIVAGLVGRNINGSIYKCEFDGKLFINGSGSFELAAGLVGAVYGKNSMMKQINGLNAISGITKGAIPDEKTYYVNSVTMEFNADPANVNTVSLNGDIVDCSLSANSVAYMLNNLSNYYGFRGGEDVSFENQISAYRVAALAVGVADEENYNNFVNGLRFGWSNKKLVINGGANPVGVAKFNCSINNSSTKIKTPYVNVLNLNDIINNSDKTEDYALKEGNYLAYIIGHKIGSFDAWDRTLNGEKVMITNLNDQPDKEGQINKDVSFIRFATLKFNGDKPDYFDNNVAEYIYSYGAGRFDSFNIYYKLNVNSADNDLYLEIDLSEYQYENSPYEIKIPDNLTKVVDEAMLNVANGKIYYKIGGDINNTEIRVDMDATNDKGETITLNVLTLNFKLIAD